MATFSKIYRIRCIQSRLHMHCDYKGFCFRYGNKWYVIIPKYAGRSLLEGMEYNDIQYLSSGIEITDISKMSVENRREIFQYCDDGNWFNAYKFDDDLMLRVAEYAMEHIKELVVLPF